MSPIHKSATSIVIIHLRIELTSNSSNQLTQVLSRFSQDSLKILSKFSQDSLEIHSRLFCEIPLELKKKDNNIYEVSCKWNWIKIAHGNVEDLPGFYWDSIAESFGILNMNRKSSTKILAGISMILLEFYWDSIARIRSESQWES